MQRVSFVLHCMQEKGGSYCELLAVVSTEHAEALAALLHERLVLDACRDVAVDTFEDLLLNCSQPVCMTQY